MPTTDVTNALIANISSTEQSTSNVDINRSTGNPAFSSNVGQFTTYQNLPTGTNVVPLPTATGVPATQVYVKNIDAAATCTVKWTPNGGASENIILLYPGDQIILWQNPSGSTAGITAFAIVVTASTCLVEYFLGG
jgi:hypothetical protein